MATSERTFGRGIAPETTMSFTRSDGRGPVAAAAAGLDRQPRSPATDRRGDQLVGAERRRRAEQAARAVEHGEVPVGAAAASRRASHAARRSQGTSGRRTSAPGVPGSSGRFAHCGASAAGRLHGSGRQQPHGGGRRRHRPQARERRAEDGGGEGETADRHRRSVPDQVPVSCAARLIGRTARRERPGSRPPARSDRSGRA